MTFNPRNGTVAKALLTLAIVTIMVAVLALWSNDTVVYYQTVDELLPQKEDFFNRTIRVNGHLVEDSLLRKSGTSDYRFQLQKNDAILDIRYSGILPDTVQTDKELLVQGTLNSTPLYLDAQQIITRCPSKYEADAIDRNQ